MHVDAVSWARTHVTVRLVLSQQGRADTLLSRVIPANYNASIDPRRRRGSFDVTLPPEVMSRYRAGSVLVTATATGGPQWNRTPPPLVRERVLRLRP